MNKKITISIFLTFIFVFGFLVPVNVLAQADSPSAVPSGSGGKLQAREANLQSRATTEINNRINVLNTVTTALNAIKKISDSNRTSLLNQIQTEVQAMQALQTKIQGDTDVTTLRIDVQSITKAYRVYWVFVPKVHVLAAADRIDDASSLMQDVASKLQARITSGGSATSTFQSTLNTANSKISDAVTHAQNATGIVIPLQPDNGSQSIQATNTAALKSARANIQTANSDLKIAYQDFKTIIQSLKSLKQSPISSSIP